MKEYYQNHGLAYQELHTKPDVNGNSRKLWCVYDKNGDFIYVSPSAYALIKQSQLPQLPGFAITPGDYQETIRIAKRLGAWRD